MSGPIRSAAVTPGSLRAGARELLPGEIEGVATRHLIVAETGLHTAEARLTSARVLLIVRGRGSVEIGRGGMRPVAALALLAVTPAAATVLKAGREGLEVLEVLMDLTGEEAEAAGGPSGPKVHYLSYAEAALYREDIKSPKTVNRTLLPVGVVPRLTIGSVQTAGPDQVGDHSHPMLEQLFFGLPGNRCLVRADEAEALFGEDTLLHIPSGSLHGVSVAEGALLHYVWMDFFRNPGDMSYIQERHHEVDGEEDRP